MQENIAVLNQGLKLRLTFFFYIFSLLFWFGQVAVQIYIPTTILLVLWLFNGYFS